MDDKVRPDFLIIIKNNERAAAQALADEHFVQAYLLVHALVEALLRLFLRIPGVHETDDDVCAVPVLAGGGMPIAYIARSDTVGGHRRTLICAAGATSRRDPMMTRSRTTATIDEYIAASPRDVQPILRKIRATVARAAPDARELISYRMPALSQDGILIYFAAFKAHIGVFPPVEGDQRLEKAVAPYAGPKGNLRFPLDEPIPYDLIRRIVTFRLKQNRARAAARKR